MSPRRSNGTLSWSFLIVYVAVWFVLARAELVLFDRLSNAGHDAAADLSEAVFGTVLIIATLYLGSDLWSSLVSQFKAARRAGQRDRNRQGL